MPDQHSLDENVVEAAPPDRRDTVTMLLFVAVAAALIGAFSLLGYLLYRTTGSGQETPRTLAELQIQTLQGVTRQSPKDAKPWALLTSVYTGAGKYNEAEDALKDGVKAVGSKPAILQVEEGRLLFAEGKLDEAVKALRGAAAKAETERQAKLAEMKKKDVSQPLASQELNDAQVLLGDIFRKQKRFGEAVKAYSVALKEDPTMADVLVWRGMAYAADGRTKEAKADYESALKYIPGYKPALDGVAGLKAVSK